MTEHDIYPVMLAAGFDPLHAETFTALALRESGGDPNAHNGDASTGDDSYGLLQINWKVDSIRNLCLRNGVTDPAMLKDPATNAKIAFLMFAGSDRNLSIGWYIDDIRTGKRQPVFKITKTLIGN